MWLTCLDMKFDKINPNDAAFPAGQTAGHEEKGLTKFEYMVTHIISGLLSNKDIAELWPEDKVSKAAFNQARDLIIFVNELKR